MVLGSFDEKEVEHVILKVNKNSHRFRQRFTVAHEFGHILVEQLVQEPLEKRCCSTGKFLSEKEEERFCDFFASYLLIPDPAIDSFSEWKEISINKLIERAQELQVSVRSIVWRVLEQAPFEGGALWFRAMGKPTDPKDIKLRLDWGIFPKSQNLYLPKYDAVPEESPIHQALDTVDENYYRDVRLDFGSLRGKRTLLVKLVGKAVLAIVFPKEFEPQPNNF